MVVTEAAQIINTLKRKVMWRKRLLALQHHLAVAILIGGFLSSAWVLYLRLQPTQIPSLAVAAATLAIVIAACLTRWFLTRATERDAAFQIDRGLELEDRIATAHAIIERGGPERVVEMALVDDAAQRVAGVSASSVVPYRFSWWHGSSLIALATLAAALMIPQRSLPGGDALIAERADIQNAGEQLEQTALEAEQIAPAGTETAKLAREQAELGRAFRRSTDTRAEALRKLSALEERIRDRHNELANTRADEIVSLAEKRLRTALSPKPKGQRSEQAMSEETQSRSSKNVPSDTGSIAKSDDTKATAIGRQPDKQDSKQSDPSSQKVTNKPNAESTDRAKPTDSSAEQVRATANNEQRSQQKDSETSAQANRERQSQASNANSKPQQSVSENKGSAGEQNPGEKPNAESASKSEGEQKRESEEKSEEEKKEGEQKPEGAASGLSGLPDFMAKEAVKALPSLSEQLLKQAEQLRADQISPEDIKRLQQAAESLARDLAPIIQSKEFQQSLEQLARQVNPEQLERVARELMGQEKLRQELEAAARLLMENRQVKEMVAGLAQKFGEMEAQMRSRDRSKSQPGDESATGREADGKSGQGQRGKSRGQYEKLYGDNRLAGRGREARLSGNLGRRPGGEYLYLQSKPGSGAARTPYSSSYPQYRREAEKSVERSQIPPHMKSVVRRYFDSINPDANKKQ